MKYQKESLTRGEKIIITLQVIVLILTIVNVFFK